MMIIKCVFFFKKKILFFRRRAFFYVYSEQQLSLKQKKNALPFFSLFVRNQIYFLNTKSAQALYLKKKRHTHTQKNMAAIPGTKRSLTDHMPYDKKTEDNYNPTVPPTFSEYLQRNFTHHVAQQDMHANPRYNENEQIYAVTMEEYYLTHIMEFEKKVREYIIEFYPYALEFFERKMTDAILVKYSVIDIEFAPTVMQPRRMPGRNLAFTRSEMSGTVSGRGIGVELDKKFLSLEEGKRDCDMMLKFLLSDIMRSLMYECQRSIYMAYMFYKTPEALMTGGVSQPRTVEEVFRNRRDAWFGQNKQTLAFDDYRRYADMVLSQRGGAGAKVCLMAIQQAVNMIHHNPVNLFAATSGSQLALKNQRTWGVPVTTFDNGVRIHMFPRLRLEHAHMEDQANCYPVELGSTWTTIDRSHLLPPSQYSSRFRRIGVANTDTNSWHYYTPLMAALHQLEFVPEKPGDDSIEDGASGLTMGDASRPGYLDDDVMRFIADELLGNKDQNSNDDDVFVRTRLQRTKDTVQTEHPYLRAIPMPHGQTTNIMRYNFDLVKPNFIGELSETNVSDANMFLACETMYEALFRGFSVEERRICERKLSVTGMKSLDKLFNMADEDESRIYHKLNTRLEQCTHDNDYAKAFFLTVYTDDLRHALSNNAFLDPEINVDSSDSDVIDTERFEHGFPHDANDLGGVNNFVDAISVAYYANPNSDIRYYLQRALPSRRLRNVLHTNGVLQSYPEFEVLSTYNRRVLIAASQAPLKRFAYLVYLAQPICLQTLRKFEKYDIRIVFGHRFWRPHENHLSLNMPFTNGEKIGQLHDHGVDPKVTYDPIKEKYFLGLRTKFLHAVSFPQNLVIMPFTLSVDILGGKSHGILPLRRYYNKTFFEKHIAMVQTNMSIVVSAMNYNDCVDNRHKRNVVDAAGYFANVDYLTEMHDSEDFSLDQEEPQFSNSTFFQIIRFFQPKPELKIHDITFQRWARSKAYNTTCATTTTIREDPIEGTVIDEGYHIFGNEYPHRLRQMQQGEVSMHEVVKQQRARDGINEAKRTKFI